MADQTRSGSGAAGARTTTAAEGAGTADQPGNGAATGTAGQQFPRGGRLPLPVPSLPVNVDPKRVLWWGGLAALATVGVIEWPVAAVVGAGTYVAERLAREDARRDVQQHS